MNEPAATRLTTFPPAQCKQTKTPLVRAGHCVDPLIKTLFRHLGRGPSSRPNTGGSTAADAITSGAKRCVIARLVLGVHDPATFTFDVPQFHKCSTIVDGLRLIKGQFGVGHCSVAARQVSVFQPKNPFDCTPLTNVVRETVS